MDISQILEEAATSVLGRRGQSSVIFSALNMEAVGSCHKVLISADVVGLCAKRHDFQKLQSLLYNLHKFTASQQSDVKVLL